MTHSNPEHDYKPIHTPVYTQADLERAATRMRDRCVERMLAQADEWEALWKADLTGEHSDKFLLAQTARELADSLQSLTLDEKEKQ